MIATLVLVESVVLAVLAVLVAGLLRAYGTVLRRLHEIDTGPGAGSEADGARQFELPPPPRAAVEFGPASDLAGESVDGEIVSARVVGVEHDSLLLFLSSGCATCETFWNELRVPGGVQLPARTRLVVVPQGAEAESPADLAAIAPPGVDVIMSSAAWRDYAVPGSPHVVYVDGPSGRIRGEGTGQSLRQVAELLARSTGEAGLLTGEPAHKPARDAEQERAVDRELLAAGILPGDRRLYGEQQ